MERSISPISECVKVRLLRNACTLWSYQAIQLELHWDPRDSPASLKPGNMGTLVVFSLYVPQTNF